MLPNGWKRSPLSNITKEKISYGIVQAGPHIENGVPYLKSSNVGGKIDVTKLNRTSQEIHYKYRRSAVHPGDIVFSLRGNIGQASIVPKDLPEANLTQGTARISVDGYNNPLFVYYQLTSSHVLNRVNVLSKGSTFKEISLEELRKVNILTAPLPEQQKIAQILSIWDKAIEKLESLIAAKQKRKKALMQQLLTGKKRFTGFEREWKTYVLRDLGNTFNGLSGKDKNDFGFGKPYIPYMNIFKNSQIDTSHLELVNINELDNQCKVKYGDIFFTTSSETPDEVGMSSVLLNKVDEVYLNSFCFGFRLEDFDTLCPEFARYLFRAEHIRKSISVLAQGATRYNLSKTQLLKIRLELPPIDEQQKIASVLSVSDQEIEIYQKQLSALKEQKKGLMQQLLIGKKRVKLDS